MPEKRSAKEDQLLLKIQRSGHCIRPLVDDEPKRLPLRPPLIKRNDSPQTLTSQAKQGQL